MRLCRLLCLLPLSLAVSLSLRGEAVCASTPSAAVLQELGLPAPVSAAEGFRVRDIVTDATTHRAFVRGESCGHRERPLVLLPFRQASATMPAVANPAIGNELVPSPAHAERPVPSGTVVEVAMLDNRVNLTVQGKLVQSAAIGGDVEVSVASLDGQSDTPTARKIHGRLVSAARVEVQP